MAKYVVKNQEEGRGKWHRESFKMLEDAAKYIRDRWQGTEYMNGARAFHTDYCLFECVGFSLFDIGHMGERDEYGWREFKFNGPAVCPVCQDSACETKSMECGR